MSRALFLFSVCIVLQQQINTWVESPLHIWTINLTSSVEFIIFTHNKVSMTSLKDNCIKGWKGLSDFLNQKLFPCWKAEGGSTAENNLSFFFNPKSYMKEAPSKTLRFFTQ